MYTSTFLVALGLAANGAVATGWGAAKPFNCPGNTPTTCSSDQQGGFNWGSASVGQQVTSYGGCSFSGVTCAAQGPGGKLSKRTGSASDKCVRGPIHGEASSCPKMGAGQGSGAGPDFSPDNYHVSCTYDTQVDFNYQMKDGSSCKHTSPCSAGGNQVQNTQCGGAVSVTCQQSQSEKQKNNNKPCDMGIHSVGFQCGPPKSIVPPPPPKSTPPASPPKSTPPSSPPQQTPPVQSKPSQPPQQTPPVQSKPSQPPQQTPPVQSKPSQPPQQTPPVESKPSQPPQQTTPVASSKPSQPPQQTTPVATPSKPGMPPYQPPSNNTTPVGTTQAPPQSLHTTVFQTTSTVFKTTEITITSCAPEITNCPAESKTPMVITSTLSSFVTICPVTATMVKSGTGMVPVVTPSSAPNAPPQQTTPVATTKPAESSPAAQPPSVPLNCPDVVPSCIATLLTSIQTECQNNADSSCFCASGNHTQFIQDCIVSHGADASEVQTALSYLSGLCAPQIPQNPSIVTHQPQGVPQQPACPSGIPATTITVQITATPTATGGAAPPPAVTPSVITVPQVQVTAPPPAPGAQTPPPAALVPGNGETTAPAATQGPPAAPPAAATPAPPAAAATTPAAAVATPNMPVYGGAPVASTGGVAKPSGPVSPPIQTGAAGKVGISFGAAAMAAALLL